MPAVSSRQMYVAENVLLDGRLALFHEEERWLVVSDLHFGYELSQRAAGRLVPLWGMASISDRLEQLLRDYEPERLIILGDFVHDCTAETAARCLVEKLSGLCELILIAGNHDRDLNGGSIEFLESWQSECFHFYHGHCAAGKSDRIQIIGHHHPAGRCGMARDSGSNFPLLYSKEIAGHAGVFAVGKRYFLDVRRRESDVALHAEPHPAVGVIEAETVKFAKYSRVPSCNAGNASP